MTTQRRCTTVRGALARAVRIARDEERLTAVGEVDALLADRLAGEVDRAKGPELVRAVAQLRAVLDRLPLEAVKVPAPGGSGDGGDGGRGVVLELLDSPPQVGDSADAG